VTSGGTAMKRTLIAGACALLTSVSTAALAFDGWKLESATTIEGKGSAWDYLALDQASSRLYIGHRKEGLQVYDTSAKKLIKTVDKTTTQSSNGATLMPEFDLGISNNEDGSVTPFKMSTLEARDPIKLGEELDTSHYDPVTKRILVNMASGKEGTDLVVLQAPGLEKVGVIPVKTKKPEHAEADGKGNLYMASRDLDLVYKFDMKTMKIAAEWPTPGCAATNSIALDLANSRIFLACRGSDKVKPSFAVMDMDGGKVIFAAEIGGGNDGIVYDAELKRIFMTNGVNAIMNIFEQVDANTYKQSEALGTHAGVRSLAMDSKTKKLYAVTAKASADFTKKVTTSVSPYYANTFFPNTFKVLVYSK
jgi:DNA-binding beta-propeller fold protein YncE